MQPDPKRQRLFHKMRDAAFKEVLRNYDPEWLFEIWPHMLEKADSGTQAPFFSFLEEKPKEDKKISRAYRSFKVGTVGLSNGRRNHTSVR